MAAVVMCTSIAGLGDAIEALGRRQHAHHLDRLRRAPLDEQPARELERATGRQHRVEHERGPAVEAVRQLRQVRVGLERLLVAGQAHEAHLGLGDQAQGGGDQADAGAQDGHQHRDVGQPLARRRAERGRHLDVGGGKVAGGLVDEHAAEAVEGLTELGVGGGGIAEDGEALRGEGVVDQGDVHRRESLAGAGPGRP